MDELEPIKISQAVKKLNLKHVVITSVDRDDLEDGGSNHFFEVINQIRKKNPKTPIEVLTPDFLRKGEAYKKVLEANPDLPLKPFYMLLLFSKNQVSKPQLEFLDFFF